MHNTTAKSSAEANGGKTSRHPTSKSSNVIQPRFRSRDAGLVTVCIQWQRRDYSASQARASDSPVSGKNFTGPLRRPAPVKASTCASHRGLPTTAIFSKSLRWLKKKSVSPQSAPRSHPEKFSSRTRSLTVPATAIFSTNSDCAASSSDFFSSPPTRRTQRRSSCCSRLALMDVWFGVCGKNSLGSRHEKHSDNGKNKQRHAEGRGEKPHSWLLKL